MSNVVFYLGINVLCLLALGISKYYRLWPIFTALQAVTCLQIIILSWVPVADRTMVIRWWVPGDVALSLLAGAAAIEVLWRSMRGMPQSHKLGVSASLLWGTAFACVSVRWIADLPSYTDWLAEFRTDRLLWNLGVAWLALVGIGILYTINRSTASRPLRMHATLFAVLACGHIVFSDATHWGASHALYRQLESACCLGWILTANLFRREVAMSLPRAALYSAPPSVASPIPARASHPRPVLAELPSLPAGPVDHHRPWQPVPHGRL